MASITSTDYFLINGVSSESVGLYVDTPPVPPMARQRYTTWKTGADMDGSEPDDVYENISMSLNTYVFFRENNFDLSQVYAFLADAKTLQLSRFPARYFKVRQIGAIAPQQQYDGARIQVPISMALAPFKYHTLNPELTVTGGTIENPGTRYSRPLYKITTKTGSAALTVNGETMRIDGAPIGDIYIDAERMIAYDQYQRNATMYTYGAFPFLSPGTNAISHTGTALTVTGNWRDY